jgi:Flp pilus assembly pilin Flp
MKLFKLFTNFKKDEDGAVTVDWVVLTAALVGLGLLVIAAIRPGINAAATSINTGLTNAGTQTLTGPSPAPAPTTP